MKKKFLLVAGARPNFMKTAPLFHAFSRFCDIIDILFIHTGQHYDYAMSDVFLKSLGMPSPDMFLNVGSGSHAEQTSRIMTAFEEVLIRERPDVIIVVGDVNSTMACSLTAAKLGVRIAHVEAGLRSFDWTMPEEINRIVTDTIADFLFVSEESGIENLSREGIDPSKVFFAGNVMIDSLLSHLPAVESSSILDSLKVRGTKFTTVTLHRPGNVDSREGLIEIADILESLAVRVTVVYPVHPRTRKMIENHGMMEWYTGIKNMLMIEPLGYCDFMKLVKESLFVLTDSGGIQEETTYLAIPCLTMRENTERPVTVTRGTNHLVGRDKGKILSIVDDIMHNRVKTGEIPPFWDGKAAERIAEVLARK